MNRKSILDLPEIPGVYLIRNVRNGWRYVGSAGKQGLRKRLRAHIGDLELGKHHSWSLQRDWDRQASKDFQVEVLATCSLGRIRNEEQRFLDDFGVGATNHSYNTLHKANRSELPQEMVDHIRTALRSDKVKWNTNKSGYRGVCWSERQVENNGPPWKASIHRNGKSYHVGYYDTPRKAHNAYRKAFALPDDKFGSWFEELKKERGNGTRGEKGRLAKLTNAQALRMRRMYASGEYTQKDLMEIFGVQNVSRIISGKSYPEA